MKAKSFLLFSIILLFSLPIQAQKTFSYVLEWENMQHRNEEGLLEGSLLGFQSAGYQSDRGLLPVFVESLPLINGFLPEIILKNIKTRKVNNIEGAESYLPYVSDQFEINVGPVRHRSNCEAGVQIIPLRMQNGQLEMLVSFELEIKKGDTYIDQMESRGKRSGHFNSKLREGKWYSMGITKTGVYAITYSFLEGNGIKPDNLNPDQLTVFGYGGAELPMLNSADRPEDMNEIPAKGVGLDDGSFDRGDALIFYVEGPYVWRRNNLGMIRHDKHLYDDEINYFLRIGGQRSNPASLPNLENADLTTNQYDLLIVHHNDLLTEINTTIKSGRNWFGEDFSFNTRQSFDFGTFPNLIENEGLIIRSSVAARDFSGSCAFNVSLNGQSVFSQRLNPVDDYYLSAYVSQNVSRDTIIPSSKKIALIYDFNKVTGTSKGWLNFFEIKGRSQLVYNGSPLYFRDHRITPSDGTSVRYEIQNAQNGLWLWEVTEPGNIAEQAYQLNGGTLGFNAPIGEQAREYVLFKPENLPTPNFRGEIENQNIHGADYADVFIVAYENFLEEANELADFHRKREGYRVNVFTPNQIYNEFSSGTQDITAIRDMLRYFYETAENESDRPQYLILFGDASYDYKDRINGNTNLVPSFQSLNSIDPVGSYVSDDYYGLLDPNEGDWERDLNQKLDIAIGRLPVHSKQQAKAVVAKIKAYFESETLGDWRNDALFIGDDEDGNLHFRQTEKFANYVDTAYPQFNVKKLYFDAFVQEIGAGGARYPEVERRINDWVEKGVLLINYMGHGGELGWAHERVLDNNDINSWENLENLPLFVTATCEFSRFDDPERISAGENVFLNPEGGAIAMLTTTRVVYAGANEGLLNELYKRNIFEPLDGRYRTLGEIIMTTKNRYNLTTNTRNFSLLGDPTIRLAFPKYRVYTSAINGVDVSQGLEDTLKALSKVKIEGFVGDEEGNIIEDYEGVLYPTIFDKADSITTLGNDEGSYKSRFGIRQNVIYKGKATVKEGEFSFEFVVPKDISYKLGQGKISYYVSNESVDGNGFNQHILIGGTDLNGLTDNEKPNAELFVDDLFFEFGGLTGNDPTLIGLVSDDNGINTVGSGIGHEMTLQLDNNEPIIVNEYYQGDLDDYRSGRITYPFSDLEDGRHSVSLKVWDVANNSAEAYTEFVVSGSAELALKEVLNFPNPMTDQTTFSFTHNRPGDELNVSIAIYSTNGRPVKTLEFDGISDGSTFRELSWDGRDAYGNTISNGLYVYRITVESSDGLKSSVAERLVIIR